MADAKTLLTGEQITLPQLASAARAMLERSQIWFATLLGVDHHLALAHQDFLEMRRESEVDIERIVPTDEQYRTYVPTLMLRWFQLRVVRWMESQWGRDRRLRMFDVEVLFDRIEYCEQ